MRHQGKRVLVTGAGRGIGWGIATAFAEEGADVAVADIDLAAAERVAEELAEKGVRAPAIGCDVTDEDQVKAMFDRVASEFGKLDVLASTVAWIDPPSPIADMEFANWKRAIRTNLDSTFLCTKYGIPLLSGNEGDALIVNVSSINGTRGFPYRAPYGASKAGIINFTETTAMELLGTGIRVNCLVPGGVAGERVNQLRRQLTEAGLGQRLRDTPNDDVRKLASLMEPIDVGHYVTFLASDHGKRINGQALWIGDAPRSGGQVFV